MKIQRIMLISTSTMFLGVINVLFTLVYLLTRKRKKGEPPLVTHIIPFVGGALEFGKDPIGYLKELQSKLGDVFTIKIAGWDYHVFMNPMDIVNLEKCKELDQSVVVGDFVTRMVGNQHDIHNYETPETFWSKTVKFLKRKEAKNILDNASAQLNRGKSNETLPHTIISNLRGSTQLNALCKSCINLNLEAISRVLQDKRIHKDISKIKLYKLCQEIVFNISFNLLMGSLPNTEKRAAETKKMYEEFSIFFKNSPLLVDRIPIQLLPETKKSRDRLLTLLSEFDWSKRTNVSSMISEVTRLYSDKDKNSRHLLILLWSAQANTLPGLFWTLFYVLRDKKVKSAILDEFNQLLKEKNKIRHTSDSEEENFYEIMRDQKEFSELSKTDLDKLVIFDSVIKEVMRITGSSMNIRRALKDTTIKTTDGRVFKIRKGDYTTFYASFTHFDPDIYENPEVFMYDRFMEKDVSNFKNTTCTNSQKVLKPRSKFYKNNKRISPSRAIMTFGFGATKCPGRHIALIEIKLITLTLLKYFHVSLEDTNVPEFDLTHLGFGIMPPKDDVIFNIAKKC